jgi:autotransporter-associated beta strand protein
MFLAIFKGLCFSRLAMKKNSSLKATVAVIGLSMAAFNHSATAAENIWNNDTDDWAADANWSDGSPADSADVAVFSSVNGDQTILLNGNRSVQGLSFINTGDTTFSGGIPASSSLTIGAGGVSVTGGPLHIVKLGPVILSANQTWSSSSKANVLKTENTVDNGGFTLTIDGASTVTFVRKVSGAGGFIKEGTNVLTLFGDNTFSGGVVLNSGVLRAETNTSLGDGSLMINGGSIGTVNFDAITASNAVEVNGNFSYSSGPGQQALTLSGPMNLNGATRTITQGETGVVRGHFITGVISNGGIIKEGDGKLTLGGANTYTGNTTVNAGTLILADSSKSAFTIGANGVNNQFNGNGTLNLDGGFVIDLTGAGTRLGDRWKIVDVGTLTATFGSTFNVVGFTDMGGNIWQITNVNGGRTYQFNESTGILSVTAVR